MQANQLKRLYFTHAFADILHKFNDGFSNSTFSLIARKHCIPIRLNDKH